MKPLILILALLISGCSSQNANLATLQFSGDTGSFPQNYQEEAARVASNRGGDPKFVRVSYPNTTTGAWVGGPKRWYVCVRGLPPPTRPPRRNWTALAESTVRQQHLADVFDVVLVFSGERRPAVTTGFDSPLCAGAAFEPITAEPPVT